MKSASPEGERQAAVEWGFQGNTQDEWFVDDIKVRVADTPVGVNQIATTFYAEAFPNPFSRSTQINFHLQQASSVSFYLYSTSGGIIYQRNMSHSPAGYQHIPIVGEHIPKGFYLYQLKTKNGTTTGKLLRK